MFCCADTLPDWFDVEDMELLDFTGLNECERDELLGLLFEGDAPPQRTLVLCKDGDHVSLLQVHSGLLCDEAGEAYEEEPEDEAGAAMEEGEQLELLEQLEQLGASTLPSFYRNLSGRGRSGSSASCINSPQSVAHRLRRLQENARHRIRMADLKARLRLKRARQERAHRRRTAAKEQTTKEQTAAPSAERERRPDETPTRAHEGPMDGGAQDVYRYYRNQPSPSTEGRRTPRPPTGSLPTHRRPVRRALTKEFGDGKAPLPSIGVSGEGLEVDAYDAGRRRFTAASDELVPQDHACDLSSVRGDLGGPGTALVETSPSRTPLPQPLPPLTNSSHGPPGLSGLPSRRHHRASGKSDRASTPSERGAVLAAGDAESFLVDRLADVCLDAPRPSSRPASGASGSRSAHPRHHAVPAVLPRLHSPSTRAQPDNRLPALDKQSEQPGCQRTALRRLRSVDRPGSAQQGATPGRAARSPRVVRKPGSARGRSALRLAVSPKAGHRLHVAPAVRTVTTPKKKVRPGNRCMECRRRLKITGTYDCR